MKKTYNLGRAVGWSNYEEFLKENPTIDPAKVTRYIYETLVTYGVTRVVELVPGNWVASNGGKFYTQTVKVPGASWGAVPIVGIDYEYYLDMFANPTESKAEVEEVDTVEKEDLEEAIGNIFGVYVSDSNGRKATNSISTHGYLTFVAYPEILVFDEKMSRISGATMKLIVRGLSLEDLDVDTLYYGPQGFIFAGNGLVEDCYHEIRDINNVSFNSSGYLWMSMGGNPFPADYRGVVTHPQGQILTNTFGYLNPDFVDGTGIFADIGSYGFTYEQYGEALTADELYKLDTAVNMIPEGERNDYLYLVTSRDASYTGYPDSPYPFFIIPVLKSTGKVNVGLYSSFEKPRTKKPIDFTRLYTANGDSAAVLYLYDKKLPDYLGNWWGGSTYATSSDYKPYSEGLHYTGNNSVNNSTKSNLDENQNATFQSDSTGRHACWKISGSDFLDKGSLCLLVGNTNKKSNGLYLGTKAIDHGDDYCQFNRIGGYIPWVVPQWFSDKKVAAFEIDLTGINSSIQSGVLYVDGNPIFPGEVAMIGTDDTGFKLVYVWNTIQDNQPKLICYKNDTPHIIFKDADNSSITQLSDAHSNRIRIARSVWDSRHGDRTFDVWTDDSNSYSFTTTESEVTAGSFYSVSHQKSGVWGYNKSYRYVVLSCKSDYVHLVSTMVWVDNPNLTSIVGVPGTYDAIVPRYNQVLPDSNGLYYYNMKSVLNRLTARKFFSDFGWDIEDYVDSDYCDLSMGEFLQECVIRSDMSVPKAPDTKRTVGIKSTMYLYSKEDLSYKEGKGAIPNAPIQASIKMDAKTDTKSFFDTVWYTAALVSDGTTLNLNNDDFPIWVTVAKSRHGEQTMSVSVLDGSGAMLDMTGNGGTIEADTITWLDLLTGLGIGKALDLLHGMVVRRTASDCNYLLTADGTKLYISKTEPKLGPGETIEDGSIGIGW